MRVTRRFRSEERGAVLVIVALSLLFLIGMLVLVVDLGHMIAVKREMVRAADAAALTAAQDCALRRGSTVARQEAGAIADENHAGSQIVGFTVDPECDEPATTTPKLVTVKLSTAVDMFFAPIFGINTSSVVAQATASWVAAGPIPISVNVAPLRHCQLVKEDPCVIEYPKDSLLEPRWGILDLANWDDPTLRSCPLSASYVTGIINGGGWPDPLPLNGDPPGSLPTYDCLDNGMQFSSWDALEGKTFWFPVIDVQNSILANGSLVKDVPECVTSVAPSPSPSPSVSPSASPAPEIRPPDCRVVNADVIDFVQMEVLTVVNQGSTVILTTRIIPAISSVPGIAIRLVD